jgi:hypothetical protein
MADGRWGHCQHCRFFASPARLPVVEEEARCTEPTLAKFELQVFGASGCNAFELRPGLVGTAEQSDLIT